MSADQKRGVLVLGAGGVGEVVAKGLQRIPAVPSITVADISEERAQAVVSTLNDPRAHATQVDARDVDAVFHAIPADCGIVIHAGIPRFNLLVMEACLRAGVHYMDMAADSRRAVRIVKKVWRLPLGQGAKYGFQR